MLFVIVKMVIPDTRTGCSDINNKLETIDLRGIDHYINSINHATELTGTENKEVPTSLNMSTRYTIWGSGCTNSIYPYFKISIEYKTLDPDDTIQANGIGKLIKHQGICTIFLEFEDDNGKF